MFMYLVGLLGNMAHCSWPRTHAGQQCLNRDTRIVDRMDWIWNRDGTFGAKVVGKHTSNRVLSFIR